MRAAMRHFSAVRNTASHAVTSNPSASNSSDKEVVRHLSRSHIFKDYERAFSEATGLPLNIREHDSWSPAHHGKRDQDSFASILARFNKARAACLKGRTDASREPGSTARTVTWFAGLSESGVPVYSGDHVRPTRDAGRASRGGSVAGVGCKSGFRQAWQEMRGNSQLAKRHDALTPVHSI